MTRVLCALLLASCVSCARTQDIYAGADFAAEMPEGDGAQSRGEAAGASAPASSTGGGSAPPPLTEPEDRGHDEREDENEEDDAQPDAGAVPSEPPAPSCPPGWDDCDGDPGNGCEAELASDPQHCGACGGACTTPDCACRNGEQVVDCPSGRADCDGDLVNGCEADLQRDLEHCGACAKTCHAEGPGAASAECNAGRCELSCQLQGFTGDCDGEPDNGCETDLFHDVRNCGMCGRGCRACVDGICL